MTTYFEDSVIIETTPEKVWQALVDTALVKQWMHDEPLDISGEYELRGHVTIAGSAAGHSFENHVRVQEFSPLRILSYSYWTSLSGLEDSPENRSRVRFHLESAQEGIQLNLSHDDIRTDDDFGHVRFYWKAALQEIKRVAESL